jgi:uncharacterized protein (UPF0276 family)
MRTLPFRGLGLSSNLDAAASPQPYRLLDANPGLFDFVEYSAPIELEQARAQATLFETLWDRREQTPVLFHPVHLNLYGPTIESKERLRAVDAHARAVGSAWVGNDVGWWEEGGNAFPGYQYIPPPLTSAGVADCVAHALHVQAHLSVPLLLENPAIVALRGTMHVLDFMAELHARTKLPLLLDVGHLLSYNLSARLPFDAGLDGFPLDEVSEVHLAGGVITRRGERGFYFDDHSQPIQPHAYALLERLVPRLRGLRALTYEGDGHPEPIARAVLRRLRVLWPSSATPSDATVESPRQPSAVELQQESSAAEPPRQPSTPAPRLETRPWELFAQCHGNAPTPEDPEGARAELEMRLAVLAERLDATFPLSRVLMASDFEALRAFAGSSQFRAAYEPASRGVEGAFVAWLRSRLREEPSEVAAAALAFETWAQSLCDSPSNDSHGWRHGAFPADLRALWHAVRALRRHLGARAAATGRYEASALEVLKALAPEVGIGPWKVAVRRVAGRLELREPANAE